MKHGISFFGLLIFLKNIKRLSTLLNMNYYESIVDCRIQIDFVFLFSARWLQLTFEYSPVVNSI